MTLPSLHQLGTLLGQGRTAYIYAWGESQVLKLYQPGWVLCCLRSSTISCANLQSATSTRGTHLWRENGMIIRCACLRGAGIVCPRSALRAGRK
jgi:hypothetical protein